MQSRFNTIAEDEWWAKLSKSKASILRGLLEHHSLATPFVELIRSIPAMREDLLIGVWHKIIAAKCDEVPSDSSQCNNPTDFFFPRRLSGTLDSSSILGLKSWGRSQHCDT